MPIRSDQLVTLTNLVSALGSNPLAPLAFAITSNGSHSVISPMSVYTSELQGGTTDRLRVVISR